jgi:hypothetical protein
MDVAYESCQRRNKWITKAIAFLNALDASILDKLRLNADQ